MAMEGFFELKTPEDLLRKLEREHERWKTDPLNVDLAWNFFVTAEHLPEWLARTDPMALAHLGYKKFKQRNPCTRICAHLANGGKHFRPKAGHTSVASVHQRQGWIQGWISEGWVEHAALMVNLTPKEQQALSCPSASIEALCLATQVLAFWEERLGLHPKPLGDATP